MKTKKHCCCESHKEQNHSHCKPDKNVIMETKSECCEKQTHEDFGCGCHSGGDDAEEEPPLYTPVKIAVSLFCLLMSLLVFKEGIVSYLFIAVSCLSVGLDIVIKAVKNLIAGEFFDEYFLLVIATTGAVILGEYAEAAAVNLLFTLGTYLEEKAVAKSKNTIKKLAEIRPDTADVFINGEYKTVNAQKVTPGDLFRVTAGMRIPLDGTVVEGSSNTDMSALTGEAIPVYAQAGSKAKSGGIALDGMLIIRSECYFEDSTVNRILKLTRSEEEKKAKSVSFIRKFSKIYTPAVIILSLMYAILIPIIFKNVSYSQSIYRALSFLVISCPCALVISVPMAFYSAVGRAAKEGVLVKGSSVIESVANLQNIAFDKTGTLTQGKLQISDITGDKTLELAAYAEEYSNHPIALCVKESSGITVETERIENYTEIAGMGISLLLDGKILICGSKKLLDRNNITTEDQNANLYIAYDGEYIGAIYIGDKIKENAQKVVNELKNTGIKNIVVLSGDHENHVARTAAEAGIENYKASLLPDEKVVYFKKLKENGSTAFVGDGINDAPVLAAAEAGITMGGLGSEAAIEAADVVIMNDDLAKIPYIIKLAKKTKNIVKFNIIFSISIKIAVLLLSAAGFTGMWAAILADVGVSLLALLNSLKIMSLKY